MDICKDLLCFGCDHQKVCGLKNDYGRAQKAVDNLTIVIGADKDGKCPISLASLDFIKPVTLMCTHFKPYPTNNIR